MTSWLLDFYIEYFRDNSLFILSLILLCEFFLILKDLFIYEMDINAVLIVFYMNDFLQNTSQVDISRLLVSNLANCILEILSLLICCMLGKIIVCNIMHYFETHCIDFLFHIKPISVSIWIVSVFALRIQRCLIHKVFVCQSFFFGISLSHPPIMKVRKPKNSIHELAESVRIKKPLAW